MGKETVVAAKVGVVFDKDAAAKATSDAIAFAKDIAPHIQREILRAAKSYNPDKMVEAYMGLTAEQRDYGINKWAEDGAKTANAAIAKMQASILNRDRLMGNRVALGQQRAEQREEAGFNQSVSGMLNRDRLMGNRVALSQMREKERDQQELDRTVQRYLERDRQMSNRIAIHQDREIEKAKQQAEKSRQRAENERQARGDRRGQFISGAMMGTGLFAVGEGGKLLSTLGLGNTPIGSAYAGGAAGMGAGMSIGMAGGPLGVVAGGAIGAIGGGIMGGVTGLVKMTMDLLMEGVTKAMNVVEWGAKNIIKLGMEYERVMTKFEILTGSKTQGAKLYGDIEKMSMSTPYTTGRISSNVEMLLGYGVHPGQTVPAARALGDIAGGDSTRYERLALAFGQVVSQGRLMGQELRQFSEAGVGAADFAETYGKSVFELKKDMEAGIVPANVMVQTIRRLTEEGGRFAGMNERISKTVEGRWNAMVGTAEMAGRRIGEALFKKWDIAGGLDTGVGMLQNWMGGGGMTEAVDKLGQWGQEFYDATVPVLKEALQLGKDFVGVLFGGDAMKGMGTWKGYQDGLRSFFRGAIDLMLTGLDLLKTSAKLVLELVGFVARKLGFSGLPEDRQKELEEQARLESGAGMTAKGGSKWGWREYFSARGSKNFPDFQAAALLREKIAGEPGNIDTVIQKMVQTIDNMNVDKLREAKDSAWRRDDMKNIPGPSYREARSKFMDRMLDGKPVTDEEKSYWMSMWGPEQYDFGRSKASGKGAAIAAFGAMGPYALNAFTPPPQGVSAIAGGLMLGGAGGAMTERERLMGDINLRADPDVQKMFEELTKAVSKAFTPLEDFNRTMTTISKGEIKQIDDKNLAAAAVGGIAGIAIGAKDMKIQPEDADRLRYEAFMKLKGTVHLRELALPASAGKDTQEAIKLINESYQQDPAKLTQESILEVMTLAQKDQSNTAINTKAIADYFGKNPPVLKPQGVK